ncbi:NAD(P)H-quinone oxidoreductase subunit H, chloroplastic [Streptomyces tendae]
MSTSHASPRETTEGTVYTVTGGDWDEVVQSAARADDERIVVNMGPQHPSTHGVLRLILEIDGETVTEARCGIGYLHTGIEKNLEYRNWTQGTTFVTRMDYLTPFFNEAAYCLGVEKLLGIEDQIPDRATIIRVMLMELNRLSSHLVAIATGGMELGATTIMIYGFRDRELILDIYKLITGLRMNHAYIRPGGLAQDLPPGAVDQIREFVKKMKKNLPEYDKLATGNPIFKGRMQDVGYLDLAGCMALGATGPVLRSTGLPHDLRKTQPYCGYETYDFDVPTADTCDSYGRFLIRLASSPARTASSRASSSPVTPSGLRTPSSICEEKSSQCCGGCTRPCARRLRGRLSRPRTSWAADSISNSPCTRARARTSAVRRPHCSTRSKAAGVTAAPSPLSCRRGPLRVPDCGE